MGIVLEEPKVIKGKKTEKVFFQVFVNFREPKGIISLDNSCGIYARLGKIFDKKPEEICDILCQFVHKQGSGFIQEYLSMKEASDALANATTVAVSTSCLCFFEQKAYFYIKESRR
jgi:hypothetical protein